MISLLFLFLNVVGLSRSPACGIDEAMLCDPAKNLAFEGRFGTDIFGKEDKFREYYYWQVPLYPITMALIYRVSGFGIYQTRIPGVFFGSIFLFLLMLFVYRLTGKSEAAIISGLLFFVDPVFIQSARAGRMDTIALTFFIASIYLLVIKKRYIWAGFFTGLGGMTHPISIEFFLAVLLILIIKKRIKNTMWFILGTFIPLIPWILYIMKSPSSFYYQFISHGLYHIKLGFLKGISGEFMRYVKAYLASPFLLLIFAFVILASLKDWKKNQEILILFFIPLFLNMFFMVKNMGYYTLYPGVSLSILSGIILSGYSRQILKKFILPILIFSGVLSIGSRLFIIFYQWEERDYNIVMNGVGEVVRKGDYVWGPGEAWYAVVCRGGKLQITGDIDPERHRVIILNVKGRDYNQITIPESYRFYERIGRPTKGFPFPLQNRPYYMDVYIKKGGVVEYNSLNRNYKL